MNLEEFMAALSQYREDFPDATIAVLTESGIIYTPKVVVLEHDPDSTGPTLWIKAEES